MEPPAMDLPALLATFLVPPFAGVAVLRRLGLRLRDEPLAYCGWAYVAGVLAVGCYLTAWLLLGLPLERWLPLPLVGLAAALAVRPRQLPKARLGHGPRLPWWYLAFVVLLLVGAGLVMLDGSHVAVMSSDEATIWARKAKMLFAGGGFGPGFSQLVAEDALPAEYYAPLVAWEEAFLELVPPEVARTFPLLSRTPLTHLDYPILNPLLQLWSFVNAGGILHFENRFLLQGTAVAMLLILAQGLLQVVRPLVAAALLLCLFAHAETQGALHNGNADGMVAAGLLVAVDAVRRWHREPRGPWLPLFAIGLSVCAWSKNEGTLYLVAVLAGCLVGRSPILRPALRWLLLPLAVVVFHQAGNAVFGLHNDLMTRGSGGGLERVPQLAGYMWERVAALPPWAESRAALQSNGLFAGFLLLLLLDPIRAFRPARRTLTLALLVAIAGLLLVYLLTPHRLQWHLETSALRVTWQVLPAVVLWIGMTYDEFFATAGGITRVAGSHR